jgi:hypothetical protein
MDLAPALQERFSGLLPDLLGIALTAVNAEQVTATLTVHRRIDADSPRTDDDGVADADKPGKRQDGCSGDADADGVAC